MATTSTITNMFEVTLRAPREAEKIQNKMTTKLIPDDISDTKKHRQFSRNALREKLEETRPIF